MKGEFKLKLMINSNFKERKLTSNMEAMRGHTLGILQALLPVFGYICYFLASNLPS